MIRCEKCGTTLQDNDVVYWKCTECDKAFKVVLPKLRNINRLKSKAENANKSLLKCPSCGKGLDDGDELLFCKCASCGNVIKGELKFFASEDKENEIKNSNTEFLNTSSATEKCPKCKKDISPNTNFCPQCGYKFKRNQNTKIDILKWKSQTWYKLPILITVTLCLAVCVILLIIKIISTFNINNTNDLETEKTNVNSNENIIVDDKSIFPFSNADWESELGDLIILHGDYDDKYDSTYGGLCYVFNNIEYKSLEGLLRYFYNDNGKLVSVRFDCDFETTDELNAIYQSTIEEMQNKLGESGYRMDEAGLKSEIWYRAEGNIDIMSNIMLRNTLMIEYLSPDISRKEPPTAETSTPETDTENMMEDENNYEEIAKGMTITVEKQCEFEIIRYNITNIVEPPMPDNYYHYFEADNGMIFVDIIIDIKSLKNKAVAQDNIIGSAKVIYDEQYEYKSQIVVEEENGKELNNHPSLYSIEPLSTLRYHFLAALPEEIEPMKKSL